MKISWRKRPHEEVERVNPHKLAVELANSGDRLGNVFLETMDEISDLEGWVVVAFLTAAGKAREGQEWPCTSRTDEQLLAFWIEGVRDRVQDLVPFVEARDDEHADVVGID